MVGIGCLGSMICAMSLGLNHSLAFSLARAQIWDQHSSATSAKERSIPSHTNPEREPYEIQTAT
jgi:hypothetical protein